MAILQLELALYDAIVHQNVLAMQPKLFDSLL